MNMNVQSWCPSAIDKFVIINISMCLKSVLIWYDMYKYVFEEQGTLCHISTPLLSKNLVIISIQFHLPTYDKFSYITINNAHSEILNMPLWLQDLYTEKSYIIPEHLRHYRNPAKTLSDNDSGESTETDESSVDDNPILTALFTGRSISEILKDPTFHVRTSYAVSNIYIYTKMLI